MKTLEFDELDEYLDSKGFRSWDYDGVIYWHHDKCEDVLKMEENGVIYLYSLPSKISDLEICLPEDEKGNKFVSNADDVNTLAKALELA